MNTIITYKGTLNGVKGLWCGFRPKGLRLKEQITVYRPDEGKIFEKDGEQFSAVILKEGESIEDYAEVDYSEPIVNLEIQEQENEVPEEIEES